VICSPRIGLPTAFEVASKDIRLSGAIVDVDPETGRATDIERLVITEADLPRLVLPPTAESLPKTPPNS
jgi:calcineurin-like phosphoesterase